MQQHEIALVRKSTITVIFFSSERVRMEHSLGRVLYADAALSISKKVMGSKVVFSYFMETSASNKSNFKVLRLAVRDSLKRKCYCMCIGKSRFAKYLIIHLLQKVVQAQQACICLFICRIVVPAAAVCKPDGKPE